jgi:hydroxymethylbilane synthase
LLTVLAPLNHADTQLCVEAERAMSRALAGSCTVPLGAYAVCEAESIRITGFVASVDGAQMLVETVTGNRMQADALGKTLAQQLRDKGADQILALLDHA